MQILAHLSIILLWLIADGDMVTLEDEAIIYTGLELNHADEDSSDESKMTRILKNEVRQSRKFMIR